MKLPSEILIKRTKWQVVFTKFDFEGEEVYGLCQPTTKTIFIRKGLTERQTLSTFIHELLHAIEVMDDITIGHKIINQIEGTITDVLRHNFLPSPAKRPNG